MTELSKATARQAKLQKVIQKAAVKYAVKYLKGHSTINQEALETVNTGIKINFPSVCAQTTIELAMAKIYK